MTYTDHKQAPQPFSVMEEAEAAWQEYATLARAMQENPELACNRAHVEKTISAHDRFSRAFLAQEVRL